LIKARKKVRATRQLAKIKSKANTIANTTDMNAASKMKAIEKLYRQSKGKKPPKQILVSKKYVFFVFFLFGRN
jgi:hypothetical protein